MFETPPQKPTPSQIPPKKTDKSAPSNLPVDKNQPEDIFEKIESSPFEPVKTPSQPPAPAELKQPPTPILPKENRVSKSKYFLILGIVAILIILGISLYFLKFQKKTTYKNSEEMPNEQEIYPQEQAKKEVENQQNIESKNIQPKQQEINKPKEKPKKDSDSDGLSDEEEMKLGTDIYNWDTDLDGLSDFEEVKEYKTNPLIKDTDGDSYPDGEEVKNGYNPLGPGRFFELKK